MLHDRANDDHLMTRRASGGKRRLEEEQKISGILETLSETLHYVLHVWPADQPGDMLLIIKQLPDHTDRTI